MTRSTVSIARKKAGIPLRFSTVQVHVLVRSSQISDCWPSFTFHDARSWYCVSGSMLLAKPAW